MPTWLVEIQASGIVQGARVAFKLPSALSVNGRTVEYSKFRTYTGVVEAVKQYQITVYVANEKKYIVVHPAMVRAI